MDKYIKEVCTYCGSKRLGELTTSGEYDFANSKIIFDENNLPKRNKMGYIQFMFCLDCRWVGQHL
jgi:hypothetical protein